MQNAIAMIREKSAKGQIILNSEKNFMTSELNNKEINSQLYPLHQKNFWGKYK